MLTLLPDCLAVIILRDWLEIEEVRYLDKVHLVRNGHEAYLSLLTQLVLRKFTVYWDTPLAWMALRKITCKDISVHYHPVKGRDTCYENAVIQLIELSASSIHSAHLTDLSNNCILASAVAQRCTELIEFSFDSIGIAGLFQVLVNNNRTLQTINIGLILDPETECHLTLPSLERLSTLSLPVWCSSCVALVGGIIAKAKQLQKLCVTINSDLTFTFPGLCPQLKTLKVWHTRSMRGVVASIAEHCPNIVNLDFQYCDALTDADVLTIAENLHHLRTLNLRHCRKVTDHSLQHLTEHRANTLQLLQLGRNGCITRSTMDLLIARCLQHRNKLILRCVQEFYHQHRNVYGSALASRDDETTVVLTNSSLDDKFARKCVVHSHAEILHVYLRKMHLTKQGFTNLCSKLPSLNTIVVDQEDEHKIRELTQDFPHLSITTDVDVYEFRWKVLPL